jgi:hypothetical protein
VKVPTNYSGQDILSVLSIEDLPDDVEVKKVYKNDILPLTKYNVKKLGYVQMEYDVYTEKNVFHLFIHDDEITWGNNNHPYEEVYLAFEAAKDPAFVDGFLEL